MTKPLSKKQLRLLDKIYLLSDESIYQIYRKTEGLEIGKPPYNHDERIAIGISFISDNSIKSVEKEIRVLEKKEVIKRKTSVFDKFKKIFKF